MTAAIVHVGVIVVVDVDNPSSPPAPPPPPPTPPPPPCGAIAETIAGQIATISAQVGFLRIFSDSTSVASCLVFNSLVCRTDNLHDVRSAHASFLHNTRYCPMTLDTSADGDGDDGGDNDEYNTGEDCKLLWYLRISAALAHAFATAAVK
jgi:hypothetical protein